MDYRIPNISPGTASKLSDIECKFLTLRSSGSSVREIARKLKMSSRTVCDWNKKFSKELLELRNKVFCDLQQKIIDSKTERLDFLKKELKRIAEKMENAKLDSNGFSNPYGDALSLYIKLSDMISICEIDLLKVGINFRDNIEPESNHDADSGVFPVSGNENTTEEETPVKTIEKTEDKNV
ncbi:MAG: helix-turn-helix domain-containing protein [Ignavibacteriae bacterium]|nr:helix-turn-helix domain-containing protein [Ignavibacteriota bacterium]